MVVVRIACDLYYTVNPSQVLDLPLNVEVALRMVEEIIAEISERVGNYTESEHVQL